MQSVIDFPWRYAHLADSGQVSAGPCVLHTVTVNRLAAGACVVTLYDNPAAAGNVIAVINLTGTGTVDLAFGTLYFGLQCATGLYASFSAGGGDITITYK